MIEIVTLEQAKMWDEIIRRNENYDVFYISSYLKAFQHQGEGDPILIHCLDGSNDAFTVMFRRDIAEAKEFQGKLEKGKYFDLVSPYGYGGFWCNGIITEQMMDEYDEFCKSNGYISEFVRFELFSDYHTKYRGDVESRTHNVVRNLDMPIDEMLMDFEHKVRKNIKHAQREELQILVEENDEHLEDFLRIYYGTMDRNDASDTFYFDRAFFETLNEMTGHYVYVYVVCQEKIISAELIIFGTEHAYSFLGGTDSEYFHVRPNDFLKFESIKWLKERGLKNFVLGGGYGADDGIFRYKKSLAPHGVVDFYIGKRIFHQELYKKMVDIRSEEKIELCGKYFPLYRA